MNIARNLENAAAFFPDRTAVIENDREVTYRELYRESSRIASALTGLGFQPGDHGALCLPNSREWLAAYFGIIKAGGVAVTLAYALTTEELSLILGDAKPVILFTTDEKASFLENSGDHPYLKWVVSPKGAFTQEKLVETGSPSFRSIRQNFR